jgi:multicomponent Na+:H+ antiporter subunit D
VLTVLLVLSGFTMLLGVLGAMCQWDIRRILSWHIISQVGYMVMGIGLVGVTVYGADGLIDAEATDIVRTMAIAGTIFYIVHHIVVKSCLFLVGGVTERVTGSQRLKQMGGVLDLAPGVAGLFLIASFSLAGMPPFSGFLAKFVVIRAGLSGGSALAYGIVAVAILTSFFTLYSMTKIWGYAFWGHRCREKAGPNYRGMMVPTGVLVVVTVVMGVWAQPFMGLANRAAATVINPTDYIRAVPGMQEKAGEFEEMRMAKRSGATGGLSASAPSRPQHTGGQAASGTQGLDRLAQQEARP